MGAVNKCKGDGADPHEMFTKIAEKIRDHLPEKPLPELKTVVSRKKGPSPWGYS